MKYRLVKLTKKNGTVLYAVQKENYSVFGLEYRNFYTSNLKHEAESLYDLLIEEERRLEGNTVESTEILRQ